MSGGTVTRVWLRLLVGTVLAAAVMCLGWAAWHLPPVSPVQVIALVGLVAVASGCTVPVRLGGQQGLSVTGLALLLALALLPAGWALVCVAAGVLAGKLAIRRPLVKAVYGAGKDTVGAAWAAAAAAVVGFPAGAALPQFWTAAAVALPAAAVAYALWDELAGTSVMTLATGDPWRQVAARGFGWRTLGRLVNLIAAAGVAAVVWLDGRLLVAAPLAVLVLYLAHTRRLSTRRERQAWVELAAAADAVTQCALGGDLPALLRVAANRARGLLPSAEAVRIVVADQAASSGPRSPQPAPGLAVPLTTELDRDLPPAGVIQLWLRPTAEWTTRERQMLTHYAASLATAARSCVLHAAVAAEAAGNAHDASHDPLTGLPNRRALHQRACAVLAGRRRGYLAIVLLDVDGFKKVNDGLGHAAGDELLMTVARRLRRAAGEQAMVARLDGDEFAVLLDGVATPTLVTHAAQRLLKAVAHPPVRIHDAWVEITASAGLAIAADRCRDPDELLHRADVAMYRAKSLPPQQQIRLDTYTHTRPHPGGLPAGPARPAGAPNAGQLQLRYQPIVDLATARAVAVDAVPYWQHPGLGAVPSEQFLALVEQCGLHELVDAVLEQALQDVHTWSRAGFALGLVVGVPPRSLADPRFPNSVLTRLRHSDLKPETLTLQLRRVHTITTLDPAARAIRQLREAGLATALGEVGTPAVTPATVAILRPDQLYVDLAAVGDPSATAPAAVFSSILALAAGLKATVNAVGVEREHQRETLVRLGFTTGQGSMFGGALPADTVQTMLERGYNGTPALLAQPLAAADTTGTVQLGHRLRGIRQGLTH